MKKSIIFLASFLICSLLFGCQSQDSQQETVAQEVLSNLLTAPNEDYQNALLSFDGSSEQEVFDSVSSIMGGHATDALLEALVMDGVGLQLSSVVDGFTSIPGNIVLTETEQAGLYDFEATVSIHRNNSDPEETTFIGQIRFNSDHKIDLFSMRELN